LRRSGRVHRFLYPGIAKGSQNRDDGDDRQQLDQSEACVALGTSTAHRDHALLVATP
jgi:hypothetical protein